MHKTMKRVAIAAVSLALFAPGAYAASAAAAHGIQLAQNDMGGTAQNTPKAKKKHHKKKHGGRKAHPTPRS